MARMPLTAGVLIIGSLYWNMEGGRDEWRKSRLQLENQWFVKAPIRYGRRSQNHTYTMVFAELPENQLGQARAVQCRNSVSSFQNLVTEAELLWAAECKSPRSRSISARWGCVALLCNPERKIPQDLLDAWANHVSGMYGGDASRLVTGRGILQIAWPSLCADTGSVPLDLLLATSNNPADQLPSVQAIAEAWRLHGDNYFRQNRAHDIQTFEDEAIARVLARGT